MIAHCSKHATIGLLTYDSERFSVGNKTCRVEDWWSHCEGVGKPVLDFSEEGASGIGNLIVHIRLTETNGGNEMGSIKMHVL